MKKFLAKIILFTIISSLMIMTSYADATPSSTSDPSGATDAASRTFDKIIGDITGDKLCITEADKDYIWVITEEPLEIPTGKTESGDYEVRQCYRNFISYVKDGQQKVNTVLALKCADEIKNNTVMTDQNLINSMKIQWGCSEVQVHLSKGGTTLLTGYIRSIYIWASTLVGVIAVTVIIISGIQLSVAGGDTQVVESAKGRIIKSLSGIALLFLSGIILYTINPTFFIK